MQRARAVEDHRAVDLALQDDDVVVERRLDGDDLAAILRDRDELAIAVLGDITPYPFGILTMAGEYGVDDDAALAWRLRA